MDKTKMQDALDVLACEIDVRPAGAPTFEQLAPNIRGVKRDERTIAITFDKKVVEEVAALVAAESVCCPDLSWRMEHAPELVVRIGASPAQLDVFEQMLTPST